MPRDAVGRDTLTTSPIAPGKVQTVRTVYDVMGRVGTTVSAGPAMSYVPTTGGVTAVPAESLFVATTYDENGNVTEVKRRGIPDHRGQGWSVSSYEYDRANRQTAATNEGRRTEHTYDANGNVIETRTARGHTITMTYDIRDQLLTRSVPAVDYTATTCATFCAIGSDYAWQFPFYSDIGGTGTADLRITADVDVFAYDVMGNMTQAYNGYARIDRTYSANGALKTDSTRIRTYTGTDFDTHVYGLTYTYDLNGRRTTLEHPKLVSPYDNPNHLQDQQYTYAPWGALASVIGQQNEAYTFTYNLDGELARYDYPSGYETSVYDDAGRRTSREDRVNGTLWHSESVTYDQRGRITQVLPTGSGLMRWTGDMTYSGLGTLVQSRIFGHASGRTEEELFRTDPLGRVAWSKTWTDDGWNVNWWEWDSYYLNGALSHKTKSDWFTQNQAGEWHPTELNTQQDAGGNVQTTGTITHMPVDEFKSYDLWEGAQNYYAADQKLRYRQIFRDSVYIAITGITYYVKGRSGVFEEYWYDALGRRILQRERGSGTANTNTLCWHNVGGQTCADAVERYLWDGDNLLYEMRYPGLDTKPSTYGSNEQYGWVGYTHAGGVDHPLAVTRLGGYSHNNNGDPVILHTDYRGHFTAGHLPDGTQFGCNPTLQSGCRKVGWAGGDLSAYLTPGSREPPDWFGSLIGGSRDQGGLRYMRNRYYDPQTGQFTQQDPIGIAGGLNLYGFANGDPVNFSDPFGLNPCALAPQACLVGAVAAVRVLSRVFKAAVGVAGAVLLAQTADVIVEIDPADGEAAEHAADVITEAGGEVTGVIDRAGAATRRAENLRGVPTRPGMDRDEFPPAVVRPDATGVSVRSVRSGSNRSMGAKIGNAIRNAPDGSSICFIIKC